MSIEYNPDNFITFQDEEKVKVTRQNVKKTGKVITLYVTHEEYAQLINLKSKMNCQTWEQWVHQLIIFFAGELS